MDTHRLAAVTLLPRLLDRESGVIQQHFLLATSLYFPNCIQRVCAVFIMGNTKLIKEDLFMDYLEAP